MAKSIVEQIELRGFLHDYCEFGKTITDAPEEFHLGAGLTALATACGSKIIYPGFGGRRQWPNLYTLLIAPSGLFRKSTAVGIAEDLIAEVDKDLILSGEQSREKFLSLLKTNPNVLYPISEFSAVLSMWNRDYSQGFKEIVVDLFDCRQEYSRQTLKDGKVTISQPALNILAASTLDWLKEKLTEGDMRGGLMGRFLLIPGITKGIDRGLNLTIDKQAKQGLADFLKLIRTIKQSWIDVSAVLPEYNSWVKKAEKAIVNDPELLGFQSRLATHTLKLAVLFTISDMPGPQAKYILTSDNLNRAFVLGKWLIDQAITLAETGFIKSKTEQQVQRLLELARQPGGIDRRQAIRRTHLKSREFDQIVQTAAERGELRIEQVKSATKPAIVYSIPGSGSD